jgi:hypothetical protein
MDALSPGQLNALRNLAEKSAGNATAFINIADARALTDLGFATRSRQGWDITAAGAAYLARLDTPDGANDSNVHPLV